MRMEDVNSVSIHHLPDTEYRLPIKPPAAGDLFHCQPALARLLGHFHVRRAGIAENSDHASQTGQLQRLSKQYEHTLGAVEALARDQVKNIHDSDRRYDCGKNRYQRITSPIIAEAGEIPNVTLS